MQGWRLIVDPDLKGIENMAADEALLKAADAGEGGCPVLRLYGWRYPTLSVGYIQNPSHLLDFGLPVVRRVTGGRAVLHDMELTYSVIVPADVPLFAGGILEAYSVISRCIVSALKDIGMEAELSRLRRASQSSGRDACFHAPSRHEVLLDGRKLVGSAQRRFKKAFLQHGSILFAVNRDLNAKIFGEDLLKRMACIADYSDIGREAFRDILIKRFAEGLNASFSESHLNGKEEYLKENLIKIKYSTAEWNHCCVRRYKDGSPGLAALKE